MIERIEDVPPGIDAVRAVGKISREDYEAVIVPLVEDAARDGRRLRCLCRIGPDFQGMTPGAVWEDVEIGLRALRSFDGCAVVSDIGWIREATRLAGFLMPCPVRVFSDRDRDKAVDWLSSLPEGAGVTHRLVPESGVVVVEIAEPLRAADFDALALTVDSWLDTHARLQGVVIRARAIHGWENIAGLVRHIRFVRDHHRKVNRVALAVDGRLAALVPSVAEHFVHAEVRSFGYDGLDDAIAWTAASTN